MRIDVEFTFSNDSLLSLSKTLSTFPEVSNKKKMPQINFGATIDNVRLETIQNFLTVS